MKIYKDCKNCDHKIFQDGTGWLHCTMGNHGNIRCRKNIMYNQQGNYAMNLTRQCWCKMPEPMC